MAFGDHWYWLGGVCLSRCRSELELSGRDCMLVLVLGLRASVYPEGPDSWYRHLSLSTVLPLVQYHCPPYLISSYYSVDPVPDPSAYMPNPVYHQVAFAAILLTTVGRFCILIRRLPDPASSTQSISQSQPQTSEISAASGDGAGAHADVKNEELVSGAGAQTQTQSQAAPNPKAITITTLLRGVIIFALGFVIWNIDNLFCDHLQAFRGHGAVPEFLGLMSHGHGWWHLMTGYGAFLLLTAGICEYTSAQFHYTTHNTHYTVYSIP